MKEVNKIDDDKLYAEIADMLRIANQAVKRAKEENKELGILDMFWKNGKVYYALTNGEITTVPPAALQR